MALRMPEASEVVAERLARRAQARSSSGSLLVALSGIDGSGKGYTANLLHGALEGRGVHTAVIHADDWLTPPHHRFGRSPTARHFYENAFRYDEMFANVVTPLRRDGHVDAIREISGRSGFLQRHTYRYAEVDVVLLEGIFLLRRELLRSYDRTIWIDCTFRTALERALERNQEHLPPEQIEHDYRTIYFPAQRHHSSRDAPWERAGIVVLNDERLAAPARPGEAAASAA